MTFELLVSCVQKDARELAEKMNIASDAVIVSQLEEKESDEFFDLGEKRVLSIKSQESVLTAIPASSNRVRISFFLRTRISYTTKDTRRRF